MIFTSCATRVEYERPQVIDEKLYRTDYISNDSLSSAVVSWKEIFTDEILQKHINKALENNLDIRVALTNIRTAEAYLSQNELLKLPTVSSSLGYIGNSPSLNGVFPQPKRVYQNTWDLSLMTSWEVDIWGKINAQQKTNYLSYLSTLAGHQAIKSQIVATIATSYYQLMMFDKQKKIVEETIQLRQESWETTKALKSVGIITEVTVQQTEALVYNAKSQLISINNAIWGGRKHHFCINRRNTTAYRKGKFSRP